MSGEEEDGNFERPPITEDLRQILEKYPPGGQILKVRLCLKSVYTSNNFQETIQNGEDAGASKITFILDEREYGKNTVFHTEKGKNNFEDMQVKGL